MGVMRTFPSTRTAATLTLTLAILASGLACSDKPSGSTMSPPPPVSSDYQTVRVFTGLSSPVGLECAPGDTGRVFIVEKTGRIRIAKHGVLLARPFLDISALVSSGS